MDENWKDKSALKSVKHVILVLSGKGGVGKSTVASQLACSLYRKGKKVGLLDIDLCGPSIPRMMKLEGANVHQCSDGWVPVYTSSDQRLGVMSIGFLLSNRDDAVVWRGPKKNSMIKQFITDVCWGNLDYLIIDTPPGTSDEHITVVESLRSFNPDGAVLVTTPQAVSVNDVRRELSFCRKTDVPVLGIIENMSFDGEVLRPSWGFSPYATLLTFWEPETKWVRARIEPEVKALTLTSSFDMHQSQECSNVFSTGGGEALAKQCDVPFLGCIPLDPNLARCLEEGQDFLQSFLDSEASKSFNNIVTELVTSDNRIES